MFQIKFVLINYLSVGFCWSKLGFHNNKHMKLTGVYITFILTQFM